MIRTSAVYTLNLPGTPTTVGAITNIPNAAGPGSNVKIDQTLPSAPVITFTCGVNNAISFPYNNFTPFVDINSPAKNYAQSYIEFTPTGTGIHTLGGGVNGVINTVTPVTVASLGSLTIPNISVGIPGVATVGISATTVNLPGATIDRNGIDLSSATVNLPGGTISLLGGGTIAIPSLGSISLGGTHINFPAGVGLANIGSVNLPFMVDTDHFDLIGDTRNYYLRPVCGVDSNNADILEVVLFDVETCCHFTPSTTYFV